MKRSRNKKIAVPADDVFQAIGLDKAELLVKSFLNMIEYPSIRYEKIVIVIATGEGVTRWRMGRHSWACYNAYVSVRALLLSLLGRDSYKPDPGVYALAVLLKKVTQPKEDVEKCTKCLEDWADKPATRCLKCAKLIAEALLTRAQT